MAQVNGDVSSSAPSSAFVQHLLDYPVVHDGVASFKQNPYGQKSLQLSDSAYKTFAQPFIPYLAGPFEFVRPYLQKADTFGDQALSKVDQQVPFVKKPTNELYAGAKGIIALPFKTGVETRDHVFKTYSAEYKKLGNGNDNVITYGKALVSTAFISSSEFLTWANNVLHYKKEEAKEAINEKANN
ncbi:hypothetical protein HYQ45_005324 [Verticillium longisporum]|uniref:CAP20 protein n=3 Tax=Verticillium TaxID=1036719 RepID=G2X1C0_VERDV|nr:CAP20 protein [Verticillium dahliae VdLs.17]KAF3344105.1 hypothetical protein VdG2_08163 [Verticillium dahliae VDG2]KAF3359459.1 Multidrug resistance protein CDR2 [Verticillium dahliae VDG1]KAG7105523.1 hypothetical protein HYQ45_018534 [Verticillium longisporum]KAH6705044.1 CAP20 protein [Verticillium dahliae]EGY22611.1 CAP20 protein [Verticillium dahliae VdLs.17]